MSGVSLDKLDLSKFDSTLYHWTSQRCLAVASDAVMPSNTEIVCGKTHSLFLEKSLILLALCYTVDLYYEKRGYQK